MLMLTRRALLGSMAAAGALVSTTRSADAAFGIFQLTGASPNPVAWYDLQIGGGGNSIGIDINPTDGTAVTWVDVAGAWLLNDGATPWSQLVNGTSMSWATGGQYFTGSYYAAVAPSNSSVIYMMWSGQNAGVYVIRIRVRRLLRSRPSPRQCPLRTQPLIVHGRRRSRLIR